MGSRKKHRMLHSQEIRTCLIWCIYDLYIYIYTYTYIYIYICYIYICYVNIKTKFSLSYIIIYKRQISLSLRRKL